MCTFSVYQEVSSSRVEQAAKNYTVVSADDFLPMFTYVLVSRRHGGSSSVCDLMRYSWLF